MEDLWEDKGRPYQGNLDDLNSGGMGEFNCVPVEITLEDLDQLEIDIEEKVLPKQVDSFSGVILLSGQMMMEISCPKVITTTKKRI